MELYSTKVPMETKINSILIDMFKASKVNYSEEALKQLEYLKEHNLDELPIVIAKTQYSISDNKDLLGYPTNYEVTVKQMKLYNGAGFITIYLGSIITMPGLPKNPNYEKIDLIDNKIIGLS
jgi:formate--tetrahydrofolate ligase